MKYELATVDDIPRLCELLNILFSQEAEFTPDISAQTVALQHIIEDEQIGDILVARDGSGLAIAMVNLLYTVSTALGGKVAVLEDMVVAPAHQDKHIGSALLSFALEHAQKVGCLRVSLLTDSDNTRAHHFYKKQGFEASDMQTFRKLL